MFTLKILPLTISNLRTFEKNSDNLSPTLLNRLSLSDTCWSIKMLCVQQTYVLFASRVTEGKQRKRQRVTQRCGGDIIMLTWRERERKRGNQVLVSLNGLGDSGMTRVSRKKRIKDQNV